MQRAYFSKDLKARQQRSTEPGVCEVLCAEKKFLAEDQSTRAPMARAAATWWHSAELRVSSSANGSGACAEGAAASHDSVPAVRVTNFARALAEIQGE